MSRSPCFRLPSTQVWAEAPGDQLPLSMRWHWLRFLAFMHLAAGMCWRCGREEGGG